MLLVNEDQCVCQDVQDYGSDLSRINQFWGLRLTGSYFCAEDAQPPTLAYAVFRQFLNFEI